VNLALSALPWTGVEASLHSWYLAVRPSFTVVGLSEARSEAEKY